MKRYKLLSLTIFMLVVMLFAGSVTTAAQATATATATPAPSKTPTSTPTLTPTPTPQGSLLILQILTGSDDVNESSGALAADQGDLWLGNAGSTTGHYLGLRFTDVAIPPGSVVHAAYLEVYYTSDQWINIAYDVAAEAADSSQPFSADNLPSQRELTESIVNHESDVPWLANTWYPLDEIGALVQEVVSRPGWQMGNSLAIIAQGTEAGGDFGRKFFSAFENDPELAVRLVIDLTPGKIQPVTATPRPTATPDPCSAIDLPIRLKVGGRGRVMADTNAPTTPLNVREAPSIDAARTGRLAQGVAFTVIDGPTCADGVAWFEVRYGIDGKKGWLAEGQDGDYFVEPDG